MLSRSRHFHALILALLSFTSVPPAGAAQLGELGVSADALLRQAVANQRAVATIGYISWMDRVEKAHGSITKLMVNTPRGLIARTVEFDDQPLSRAQRQQEDEHLNRLLDPEVMREKAKKQREDEQRVDRLLAALPDGLRCEYAPEQPQNGTVRLACSPNPEFSPPNYESQVLRGMKGEIEIDRKEKRLTSISGTLFKDVSFGWGILGRLKRGGEVQIEQSKVLPDRWAITLMNMRFDGKIMLFKSLHVELTQTCWDFQPVPEMTVAEAIEFLRNAPTPTAAHGRKAAPHLLH